jgi:HEAT repeat protein
MALKSMSTQDSVIRLIGDLGHEDIGVRFRACWALGSIGSPPIEATPALIKTLRDPSAIIREAALTAIWKIRPDPSIVITEIISLLRDSDWRVRERAARVLGDYGGAASESLPALAEAENDPDELVRESATRSFNEIRVKSPAETLAGAS